jgi:hypothetical protein
MILKHLRRAIGWVRVLVDYLSLWFVKVRDKRSRSQSCKKGYKLEMPDANLIPVGHSIILDSYLAE